MAKKKTVPAWLAVLEGVGIALGVYLGMHLLLALLLVKGVAGESAITPLLAAACAVSVLSGGLFAVRQTNVGTLVCALCVSGGFAGSLVLVALGVYNRLAISGGGGILLLSILGAGVLTGLLGGKKRRPASRLRKG